VTRLYLAIVHHPVRNRRGEVITATVDHFDVFDAFRLARVYPLAGVFVVNPEPSQRALVGRLITHGADPARAEDGRECFDKTYWAETVEAAAAQILAETGEAPVTVATSARAAGGTHTFGQLRADLATGRPHLLWVGKAWGMDPGLIAAADVRLEPIDAGTGSTHLSVRSAMAILVDRLLAT
jgi:hypothetical protein